MKSILWAVIIFILLNIFQFVMSHDMEAWGNLEPGPFAVGFKLIELADESRSYPAAEGIEQNGRLIRVYIWYPAQPSSKANMNFNEYIQMAADDFSLKMKDGSEIWPPVPLPVPLDKGISREYLRTLWDRPTLAVRDAQSAQGNFPLLVIGQGLYYESPLSQFTLCEYLASQGYVVGTCPLVGTQYRLVNLNVEDLETQIRDMEFVLGYLRTLSHGKKASLGIVGYDLGGMSGLVFAMRHPEVKAFLSLDSGILVRHFSGLPMDHPSYDENRFVIPWLHFTQARFAQSFKERGLTTLLDRKSYGDSYVISVSTTSHGDFSAYAMLGMQKEVSGYWGPIQQDPAPAYEDICRTTVTFFDAMLKQDEEAQVRLKNKESYSDHFSLIEIKEGREKPPAQAEFVNLIINQGMNETTRNYIEQALTVYPDSSLFSEDALNWLGYHFLYWWGREKEAVDVFRLNVRLFPKSANAYDSLGEALLNLGETESAVENYRKSLELNPQNQNAITVLERLGRR